VTGEPFDPQDLTALLADQTTAATVVHRIFSRGLSPQQRLLAANRLFLPTETDPLDEILTLLTQRHVDLDDQTWKAVLTSHCLDSPMIDMLGQGDSTRFLTMRQDAIFNQLHDFLARMAEWDYEDTPALESLDFDELDELDDSPE
jgi:hypothetical protein